MPILTIDNSVTITTISGGPVLNVAVITGPAGQRGPAGTGNVLGGGVTALNSLTGALYLAGIQGVDISQSGQTFFVSGNGGGVVNTGDFVTTGQTGQFYSASNPQQYTTSGNLTNSGVALVASINSLSGYTVGVSGGLQSQITAGGGTQFKVTGSTTLPTANLTGVGSISVTLSGSTILVSGAAGGGGSVTQGQLDSLSGWSASATNLTATGVTLGAKTDLVSGLVLSSSGGLETRITATGNSAITHTNGMGTILSGNATQTGAQLQTIIINTGNSAVAHANGVGSIVSGNLTQTGATLNTRYNLLSGMILTGDTNTGAALYNLITALSGQANTNYATVANLTTTGLSIQATGSQAWNAANNNGINLSGNATSSGQQLTALSTGLSGALINTGVIIEAQINSLSGFTLNASGYLLSRIAGASAGVSAINGSSGSLSLIGTGGLSILTTGQLIFVSGDQSISGALTATGVALGTTIINTGNSVVAHANGMGSILSGNATQSGVQLQTIIVNTGVSAITHANGMGSILSGNMTQTGVAIEAQINSLSGFTLNASGYLLSRIAGASAGVSAINGASGSLSLIGTGGLSVLTTGQLIFISGDQSISGALTATGVALGATIVNTGNSAVTHANGIGAILSGNATQSGVQLQSIIVNTGNSAVTHANGIGSIVSGNLTATGVTLTVRDNLLSGMILTGDVNTGNSAVTHANGIGIILSGNATQSGIQLQGIIVNTGVSAVTHANGIGSIISGNLTATGATLTTRDNLLSGMILTGDTNTGAVLYGLITALSGQANTNYATIANLALTGSGLQTSINSLSGFTINASGALQAQIAGANGTSVKVSGSATLTIADFTGIGGTLVFTSGGQVFVSGGAGGGGGITQGQLDSLSGYTNVQIAATGLSATLNSSGIGVTLSGNATATGIALGARIDLVSGLVLSASGGLETRITATGNSAVTHANGIGSIISGNLTTTGVTLTVRDNLLSGMILTGDVNTGNSAVAHTNGMGTILSGNMTQTGVQLQSIIVATGTSAVTHANGIGQIISGNLTATGATLTVRDNLLSGMILTGDINTGNSAVAHANGMGTILSGNMTQTGVQLQTIITNTGTSAINHANGIGSIISGNLTATGAVLTLRDNLLSGTILTGLFNTGSILDGRINSLSGFTINVSGALQALIAGGGSVVKITGSAALATADFTGIGGLLVFSSGGQVFISGAAPGAGGGVPSVNGITSAVTIQGTGGLAVTSQGAIISISGLTTVGPNQIVFSNTGTLSGTSRLEWYHNIGTLEIGGFERILPTNPLAIISSGDTYYQLNIQNLSTGNYAQSDVVLTADIGTDTSNFVDLGINNTAFQDTGYQLYQPYDGFLYTRGGNTFLGTATAGDVIGFHTDGIQSGNLRVTIDQTGILLPSTGIIRIGQGTGGVDLDTSSLTLNLGTISGVGLANKPGLSFSSSGWGNTYYQSAFYDNRSKFFSPNNAATQSIWGDTAANVGTLALTNTEALGEYTQITPAAGLSAGLSATNASIYRGSVLGLNGFFYTTKFMLNTAWGTSGRATSSYGEPSGCRFFAGLTDQAVATQVGLSEPVGNHIGLTYMWASGGTVSTGMYWQNWAIRSRNNVSATTGHTTMSFQTGYYRFSMFCKPFPNNTEIYYELRDLLRGSGIDGSWTQTLPVGSTAMRPMVALGFVSGIKVLGCHNLYVEKQGSLLG